MLNNQPPQEESLSDLLARLASDNSNKMELAMAIIEGAKDLDPSAVKAITQALADNQYKEIDNLPISDERFSEIVCAVADHIRGA